MSGRWLIALVVASAAVSVGIAWLIFRLTHSFLLPIVPFFVGPTPVVLFFILMPALATLFMALGNGASGARAAVASIGSGVLTVVLAWSTWIGLIVTSCGILGQACFD